MKNVKEYRRNEIFIQIFIHSIEFIIEFTTKIIKIDTLNMTVICYVKLLILHINMEHSPNIEFIIRETYFHLKFNKFNKHV